LSQASSDVSDQEDEDTLKEELEKLHREAREFKAAKIRPTFTTKPELNVYTIDNDRVDISPGAYGAWVHWDTQLWFEYVQFVELVTPMALFSLSMPNETEGTYTWLLPVEKQGSDYFCKLPKRSIGTPVWVLALVLDMSTLPSARRSTWYVESDHLINWHGLVMRYIQAAFRQAAPVEAYGYL